MSQSRRVVVHGVQGRFRGNVNFEAIKSTASVVQITAGEIVSRVDDLEAKDIAFAPEFGADNPPPQNFIYHLGDANVWVSNISPHGPNNHFLGEPGGVEYVLHVDWRSPIDVAVTITVEDRFPIDIQKR